MVKVSVSPWCLFLYFFVRNNDYLCSGSHFSFFILIWHLCQSVFLPVVSGVLTAPEQYSYRPRTVTSLNTMQRYEIILNYANILPIIFMKNFEFLRHWGSSLFQFFTFDICISADCQIGNFIIIYYIYNIYIIYIIYNNKVSYLTICGNADVKSEKLKKWRTSVSQKFKVFHENNWQNICIIQNNFVPLHCIQGCNGTRAVRVLLRSGKNAAYHR